MKYSDISNRRVDQRLKRRQRAERRYRLYGQVAITLALLFLLMFFASIITRAVPAFYYHRVNLTLELSPKVFAGRQGEPLPRKITERQAKSLMEDAIALELGALAQRERLRRALIAPLAALELKQLLEKEAEVRHRLGDRLLLPFVLNSAGENCIRNACANSAEVDDFGLSEGQRQALSILHKRGLITRHFNLVFFTHSDSRSSESAGILGALLGSFWALLIAFLLAFPLGLFTAIHLQEFAPRNRLTYLIEVAIYNLAAVPSIVFGLLGLAIFLNWWHLPRSAPLVGGMVLALMTLPTIVVASRNALAAVAGGIRSAGLALGASRVQVVFHHVLPSAMPGILTGTIIGMAQALGETAPLLMIGMVAFIAQAPLSPLEPATALPVQIFIWADHPDPAFSSRSAAAILVMLVFLIVMNSLAVILRRSFERSG